MFFVAGAAGIEPTQTVLETVVLPLYDAPTGYFIVARSYATEGKRSRFRGGLGWLMGSGRVCYIFPTDMQNQHYRSLVAVYALVINEQNEILLLRRANTGFCDGFYAMPAGHLEEGETLRQAVVRELKEEVGILAKEEDAEFVQLCHRFSQDRVYLDVFFRIRVWSGEVVNNEPEKCDHIDFFPTDSLPQPIVSYQHRVIEDCRTHCVYREFKE